MTVSRRRRWPAPPPFLVAALAGAYVGVTLQMALVLSAESLPDRSEIWAVPLLLFWYGLLVLPFVALGLALFGIPAARLLHRWRHRPWMGLVAAVSGALAGKLAFYAVDHLLFFGSYRLWAIPPVDLGLCYGIPTGLAWWWFKRKD